MSSLSSSAAAWTCLRWIPSRRSTGAGAGFSTVECSGTGKLQLPPPPPQPSLISMISFRLSAPRAARHLGSVSSLKASGEINFFNLRFRGIKAEGTEGRCYRCVERSSEKEFALKRARLQYPNVSRPHCRPDSMAFFVP